MIYTKREQASHTEKKCLEEQLRSARQEFKKFKEERIQIETQLKQTIINLEKNFSTHNDEQKKHADDYQPQPASITENQSLSHETPSKLNMTEDWGQFFSHDMYIS